MIISNQSRYKRNGLILVGAMLLSLACIIGAGQGTAIPAGRPVSFEVQTATPTLAPEQVTVEPELKQAEVALPLPLSDAPTHTPDPNATPTLLLLPTNTPVLTIEIPTVELTKTVEVTKVVVATPTPQPVELDPPRAGGDWDFEAEFIPWPNPHGEPCPGARVASGWTAFVERGEFGSSCMNENLYEPNVFSGLKSQEITFDFIAAHSGIFRVIPVQIGHQYNIVAHAKHDRSLSPVEIFLGIDRTGGTIWNAETVEWFPWDSGFEDTWVATEETVTATGESITIFIRGFHPLAEQGGKTVIDNVSVTDLGP